MKLTFVGARGAFTVARHDFHSNALLESDSGRKLLIDCGSDARHSLFKLGYTHQDITAVYVSHAHADHAGGLEWLALTHKFDPNCGKPRLYVTEDLADSLWRNTVSGGLRSLHEERANLLTFFDLHAVRNGEKFVWEKIGFRPVEVIHVYNGPHRMPCHGLFFHAGKTKVFFTADTRFTPDRLMPWYEKADLIFHDCEVAPFASGIHARYEDLSTLPSWLRKKIWMVHYSDHKLPNAKRDGFGGFVKRGQVFSL